MITSQELRKKWLQFYVDRGHIDIGAVSLVGDGTTGVMFNVAGMQPLMPYLLGEKHPKGKRLCNVQGCVRTVDIEEVGDSTHFTFFEMMGNWSLGDYFKKEKTAWSLEFLTNCLGLDKEKIVSTVFIGDANAPRDDETANYLLKLGIAKENIFYLDKKHNWWELEGSLNTPCGPDNEWFYPRTDVPCMHGEKCDVNCDCGRFVEIGNDVYMQYKKTENGYQELSKKNVDTGFGLDRLLAFLNGYTDGYKTDLFSDVIYLLEEKSGKSYNNGGENQRAMRIIADHIRTVVMLIGDENALKPSNTGAGYILRRLLRRAVRYCKKLTLTLQDILSVATIYIDKVYGEAYPRLVKQKAEILKEISEEVTRFELTLEKGMKEFEKFMQAIERKNKYMLQQETTYKAQTELSGKQAFQLYETYGFPLELIEELAKERGYTVDKEGFDIAFKEHQQKSHATGQFKGGLADQSIQSTRLHTATHLLLAALQQTLSKDIIQKGSNITPERLRFDFNFDRPLTPEELRKIEALVNSKIQAKIPVVFAEMPAEEARAQGACGIFNDKYGDIVKTYKISDFSFEFCGGPHVENTGELGHFKIVKEQSSSSGIRRIKAILEE